MEAFTFSESQLERLLFRAAGGEPVADLMVEVALDREVERAEGQA